ncbi:sigma-70 family RNA polymerase sigma factor [Rhizobium leguminosarum]|uniref:sigma-70 family RNA polymerase sigma factor n=1 Tax=Rhizobium TaxID=379 RepID=UPI0010316FCA|nr:sigma-70 family RNA polymerase sigma factor [Rhizobium ruizarguesonis]TCA15693.1 sigma-70 family RNA polymerase sigma factor [Rhizobium leguminosarum bv. viciae]NEI05337.1 sigma-70 family RNA polymerase sigma factor [Rhizobium ruizarguesonis]NEI17692.1 sigma-70 family RNA polymerase sigma factor [Rhizobium ruizarguesonis]TBA94953.1 sigma-70 family RNA polymerase sigma factor [Rhizobium ruizarguesonis]TBB83913.1 sigma-70 family RNA polymerase sigma factor [Rhizobium ruizarguesonis]
MQKSVREKEWAEMMRAAVAGNTQAYRNVLAAMTPHLRAMARRRCDQFGIPASEAEDAVQEVLLTIHLKRGSWDVDRPIGPWLSTIVRNKLIDFLRKRGKHVVIPIHYVAATLGMGDGSEISDRLDVEKILHGLKHPQRTIVRSISMEGASVRETAAQLNMSEVAVRVSLHRALKALSAVYRSDHENE